VGMGERERGVSGDKDGSIGDGWTVEIRMTHMERRIRTGRVRQLSSTAPSADRN
jgi:hypothetical protein